MEHIYCVMTTSCIALASASTVTIQLHLRPVSKCTDWVVSAAYSKVQCEPLSFCSCLSPVTVMVLQFAMHTGQQP